jgi:hypothetical protein
MGGMIKRSKLSFCKVDQEIEKGLGALWELLVRLGKGSG